MEIQQSPVYATFIRSLGWIVEYIDGIQIFIRSYPLIGGLAKMQRSLQLPNPKKLEALLKNHNIRTLVVEPDSSISQKKFTLWCKSVREFVRINTDPYIPSKTIRVDLTAPKDEIFHRFSEAKRRGVRRAQKAGISVTESSDMKNLIRIKNKSAGFMGFITTAGMDKLWQALPEKNKTVLLAHDSHEKIIGGIFLIFWEDIAYYWIAGAIKEGKKQFAPTLLVWEAILAAKNHGMKSFDFVGVWDERIPDKNQEWHGFTKFKEGFGGSELYYPIVLT